LRYGDEIDPLEFEISISGAIARKAVAAAQGIAAVV
jgi:hypothetical protein